MTFTALEESDDDDVDIEENVEGVTGEEKKVEEGSGGLDVEMKMDEVATANEDNKTQSKESIEGVGDESEKGEVPMVME